MKGIIAIILIFALLLGTTACGQPPADTTMPSTPGGVGTTGTQGAKTVKILLDANGGICDVQELVLTEQDCYGQLPQPQREGYVFQGWYTDAEAGQIIEPATKLLSAQTHTLYAHWRSQTAFTITFDPNGGRISPYQNQMVLETGECYGALPQPIREGYTFLGWYTAPEAGEQILETTQFTQGQETVLYAQWAYDALAYWTYVLHSRVETIPQCRRVVVYLEKTSNYKTFLDSSLLTDAGAINPAERLTDEVVTDDWIRSVEPYILVKLTSDIYMGAINKVAMQRRLAELDIYIFPVSAVNGSESLQIYYRLQLAKILYPEYFADVDLKSVAAQLQITPRIFH